MKDLISLIIPAYNEESTLLPLWDELKPITEAMSKQDFEIIFINDGSSDSTLSILKSMSETDERIKYISFSRNFGKEAAIFAGLEHSKGDYVVIMDADLQDPPSLLPEMYRCVKEEGYDSVATRRTTRKGEPIIRSFLAHRFYSVMSKISTTNMMDGARDYRFMNRKFTDSLLGLREYNRFSKGLFGWVGFKTKWLDYENIERVAGNTKWSFWSLFKYSIEAIAAFSTAPLLISSFIGLMLCTLSFIFIFVIIIRKIFFGGSVEGWASTICILSFLSGVQLFSMGIIGLYLSKLYMEVKGRPLYIIKEDNIDNKEQH